jgi:hypothetical protein
VRKLATDVEFAILYALGTAIGGAASPLLFGYLVGTGSLWSLAGGYVFAALLMLGAALTEYKYGVDAEIYARGRSKFDGLTAMAARGSRG